MTRSPAEVGSAANNSYEILAKLAMGGMAEIFLARGANAAGIERYVVLKRVLRHRADDAHFVRMFLDEARLAAQLQHPNIAQVYDIGKLGDSYFFTMEYVHGETVRTLLQRSHALRRQIPIASVLSIVAGAAAGLHHAHERKGIDNKHLGIVHRDVSPSNVMVSYEGSVKVVDFGVAKAAHNTAETQAGTVKGKISYMSPEQCRGGDIDRRSDLFSLGILMWEMLTTERLFRRPSDFENMQAIVSADVLPPSSLRPEIPPEVDAIVLALLAKSPDQRFQTGDQLHEAIEGAAVRTGSVLSAASLGRYMRELFGQRPEPWIELASHESHPEVFTVTSQPMAAELPISPADNLDLRLDAVPALPRASGQHTVAQSPLAMATTLHVQVEPLAAPWGQPNVLPLDRTPQPVMQQAGRPITGPNVPDIGALGSQPSFTPSAVPGYPEVPFRFPIEPSFRSQHAGYPAPSSSPSYPSLIEPRRSRAALIIVPAVVIGIGIGIVLALRGDDRLKPLAKPAVEEPAIVTPQGAASGSLAPTPSEPTIKPTSPTQEPGAPAGEPGAAVEPSAAVEASAAVEPGAPSVKRKSSQGPPTRVKKDRPPDAKPEVEAEFRSSNFGVVVDVCAASPRTVAQSATSCTLAACRVRENAKARRWFPMVPASKRAMVTRECGGIIGTESAGKPQPTSSDEECKRDPMACQH